nr:beta-fructofuranosidase [Daucus carota]
MDTYHFLPSRDLEHASSYTPRPDSPETRHEPDPDRSKTNRRPIKIVSSVLLSTLILSFVIFLLVNPNVQQVVRKKVSKNSNGEDRNKASKSPEMLGPPSRGVSQGVSEKSFRQATAEPSYPWTNDMLSWQRTSFHFQPQENWMNDPNGPLFHMGWYHLFYQYNPDSAIWGNITWGHAISRDLINWLHLPFAMQPDQWYDINGVWTGSATILPDGKIVMLYTGDTDDLVQVQNLAYPANLSDPLLLDWIKYPDNPVMFPPPGIGSTDFRDPTTAWIGPDGKWRITIGSKVNKTGISLMYKTTDFITYELLDNLLHAVPGTGMWECVDFYPVSVTVSNGLDTSVNGPGVKHVLKSSLDDDRHDYYALGTYDPINDKWTPDNPELDVGIGLRLDYGKYYASKTFYDQDKERRLLWGWIGESDNESTDLLKGWASVQSIPRTVVFDKKTGTNILQWPVKEVESLRSRSYEINDVELKPGSLVPLKISSAAQLDIVASFEVDEEAFKRTYEADASYNCTASEGAAGRGILGPFGILVLADDPLSELTPVYFYIAKGVDGNAKTYFCADQSRSSTASDVDKEVYGSDVPVLPGESLSMRLLVDHSIVESFAQGGRTVITSRVYPTRAIYSAARVFLFNNATGVSVTASVKAWQMASATLKPFPFDQL